jgi:transposase
MAYKEVLMTNKRYPDEFKIEAVRQITDRGHSVADVSKRLDVSTHSLYAWVKKFGPDAEANQSRNEEQAELKRLRKEISSNLCFTMVVALIN